MMVSNATPFISFSRIGRLKLLQLVLGDVLIPQAVFTELTEPKRLGSSAIAQADWIITLSVEHLDMSGISADLGKGEREAIALAMVNKTVFLSDDSDARAEARKHGVAVSGSLGILNMATELGLIQSIKPVVDEMIQAGFYLNPALYRTFLREAGEL